MIPPEFSYAAPDSLDEALRLLADGEEEAKVLAGGQSLLALMKLRLAEPQLLVDLRRIPGLTGIERSNGDFEIGASTRHAQVAAASELGLAAQAAGVIADQQVRNRGTIGGTLAHGDPAADMPAVLVATEGLVVARSLDGQRQIVADELFLGDLTTAVEPSEVITRVRIPALPGYGFHYEKFVRRAEDWAMVGVVALVAVRNGVCEDVRIALSNMGSTPLRVPIVENALLGKQLDADAIARAAEHAADDTDPPEDLNATADYKRHLARVLTRRALTEAVKKVGVDPQVRPSSYRETCNLQPGRRTGSLQTGGGGTRIEHSFDVDAPLDRVWSLLTDIERVAPCLPGAQIVGRANGIYEGEFHVKVGPASAAYRGIVELESVEESAHTLVMKASGKDKHGQGSASATIAVDLSERQSGGTHVALTSTFTITGTLARFGRSGMIEDVAGILLEQFAACVEAKATGSETSPSGPGAVRSGRIAVALFGKRLRRLLARLRRAS